MRPSSQGGKHEKGWDHDKICILEGTVRKADRDILRAECELVEPYWTRTPLAQRLKATPHWIKLDLVVTERFRRCGQSPPWVGNSL